MELPTKKVTRYTLTPIDRWIFAFGSLEGGLTFVGSFPNYEAAHRAARTVNQQNAELIQLYTIEESTHYIKYNPDLED